MGLTSIPLFAALTDKMRWHQQRQTILAENVANADTPDYVGKELKPFNFADEMGAMSMAGVTTSTTSPKHISVSSGSGSGTFGAQQSGFEITPQGNQVTLEDEMMKVTANEMDYQAVTTLYTRSLKIIRTALGRQA